MKIIDFSNLENVFIIAELSANHNGNLDTAIATVRAAKRAGADAIKLQTYTADTLTINSKKSDFIIKNGSIWDGKNFYELYQEAFTPWEWHAKLFQVAKEEGLVCFSSPFDKSAVDFLEKLNVPCYKIASFEITDIPLIKYVASKEKPIILSTGIAKKSDIELALSTIRNNGNNQIVLLKCTSSYPAPLEEANLKMIQDFRERFNVIPGLSDHTLGEIAPLVAVSLGAKIIEKHFILDRSIGGPDSSFSMDESEFKKMVNSIRKAELAIGKINYELTDRQLKGRNFSRSLYVVSQIEKGQIIDSSNIKSIRPGYSEHPKNYDKMISMKADRSYQKGDRIFLKDLKL
jgi:pseudaminic acid synthase